MEKKRFKIATLGCRTNQYESQAYADQLKKEGYIEALDGEEADLCIVNTCTVTDGADRSSRHQIRSFLRENPQAKIAVTGCMAESAPDEILQISSQIELVPNLEKEKLIQKIIPKEELSPFEIDRFDHHTRAFVKVQDGCNSFCTYCIIPYVRGRSRSRKIEEIIQEVQRLVASGYQEVVITGINVGDFDGGSGQEKLSDLVKQVDNVEGLKRLRISSIDPDEIDEELMKAVAFGKTTCPSMHIVLQSGSNAILKRMNRKYTKQQFIDTVQWLKEKIPDFTVTTDIIVGFPGETEQDFQETLDLVETIEFAKVHIFPYSARKRTRAYSYPNQVPDEVIAARKKRLSMACEKTAFRLRERYVGRRMQVLVEGDEGKKSGHTVNFLPVLLPNRKEKAQEMIEVELYENLPEGLVGR